MLTCGDYDIPLADLALEFVYNAPFGCGTSQTFNLTLTYTAPGSWLTECVNARIQNVIFGSGPWCGFSNRFRMACVEGAPDLPELTARNYYNVDCQEADELGVGNWPGSSIIDYTADPFSLTWELPHTAILSSFATITLPGPAPMAGAPTGPRRLVPLQRRWEHQLLARTCRYRDPLRIGCGCNEIHCLRSTWAGGGILRTTDCVACAAGVLRQLTAPGA